MNFLFPYSTSFFFLCLNPFMWFFKLMFNFTGNILLVSVKRYKLSVGTASTGGQEASFMFSQSPLIFFLPRARSVSLIGPPCYPSGILKSRVLADPGCQKQGPGLCGDRYWALPSAPAWSCHTRPAPLFLLSSIFFCPTRVPTWKSQDSSP